MTDLTPGRALDERVARLVWSDASPLAFRRPFSTDRKAAMALLDTLAGRGWGWEVGYGAAGYRVELLHSVRGWHRNRERYAELPLAVCAAVLAALGEGEA